MIITRKKDIPTDILQKYPDIFKSIRYNKENEYRLCIDPVLLFDQTNNNNPCGNTHQIDALEMQEYFSNIPAVSIKISEIFGIVMATYDGNHRIRTFKHYNDEMEEIGLPKIYLPVELIVDDR